MGPMTPADDVYTHGHHEAVLRSHRWRTAANSAAYLVPHLAPGRSLLDVGSGPGTLTVDLARHVAPGRVVGVDVAEDVVEEARRHLDEARAQDPATPPVEFLAGDVRTMRLPTFDVVHAHQVLQHLRDPVGALAAMAERVAPGGLLAVRDVDFGGTVWAPREPRLARWLEVYLATTAHNGAEARAGRHLPAWARAAGLTDVEYRTSTWTFTGEDTAWWASIWADRTLHSSFGRQAVEYGIATPDELAELAAGWHAWATDPDAVFVHLHGELLARP
jgi:2-polyprenyl-3-methyl-5-hydroxy-6-metoxy-1,4-benzoquinol methylase